MPGAFLKTDSPRAETSPDSVIGTGYLAPCWTGFRMGHFLLLQLWVQGTPRAFYI